MSNIERYGLPIFASIFAALAWIAADGNKWIEGCIFGFFMWVLIEMEIAGKAKHD